MDSSSKKRIILLIIASFIILVNLFFLSQVWWKPDAGAKGIGGKTGFEYIKLMKSFLMYFSGMALLILGIWLSKIADRNLIPIFVYIVGAVMTIWSFFVKDMIEWSVMEVKGNFTPLYYGAIVCMAVCIVCGLVLLVIKQKTWH